MPVRVSCACGRVLLVPRARAGTDVRCPKCGHTVAVPALLDQPARASRDDDKGRSGGLTGTWSAGEPVPPPVARRPAGSPPPPPPPPPGVPAAQVPSTGRQPAASEPEPPPIAHRPSPPIPPAPPAPPVPSAPPSPAAPASAGAATSAGASAYASAPASAGTAAVSEAERPRAGYEHEPGKLATAYYLGAATAGVALLGIAPAIYEVADHFRHLDDSPGIARWTWLLLVLGCVQLAYALYVVQLPDWSSVWVVALACLGLAAAYAMVLGAVLLSTADNGFIQFMHLHLVPRRQTSRWCFMMLSLTSLLTYFAGRAAVRWHHTYRLMTGQ